MIRANVGRIASLLTVAAIAVGAQDTTGTTAATTIHALPVDSTHVVPFRHVYDMRVTSGDTATSIGERVVALAWTTYNGDSAWVVTETRTGLVPSTDSLFLSRTLRPLHWSSVEGLAHFGAEFVGDSIYGATTGPTGRQSIAMAGRADLIASGAMLEAVLSALPLAADFRDSASVLDVTLTSSAWQPAELAVIGEEDLVDEGSQIACWVVALRQDERQALFWVEKATGATLRVQQLLPPDVGGQLDYVLKPDTGSVAP